MYKRKISLALVALCLSTASTAMPSSAVDDTSVSTSTLNLYTNRADIDLPALPAQVIIKEQNHLHLVKLHEEFVREKLRIHKDD